MGVKSRGLDKRTMVVQISGTSERKAERKSQEVRGKNTELERLSDSPSWFFFFFFKYRQLPTRNERVVLPQSMSSYPALPP